MPDVIDMLRTLPHAVTPEPAGPDIAAADVARGHRALSRLHHRRIAGTAGAVAVVAGLAVAIGQPAQCGKSTPPAARGTTFPQASMIRLTAYTGTQPVGFKVATVPAGWQVVSSDAYSFVVAPPGAPAAPAGAAAPAAPVAAASVGARGAAPAAAPATRKKVPVSTPGSYAGRIVVMLQGLSQLPKGEAVTTVTVNGEQGQLGLAEGGIAKTRYEWLIYPDGKGRKILIQLPTSVGLTTAQLMKFADGITVTSAARTAGG
jgi:hypothetical protein